MRDSQKILEYHSKHPRDWNFAMKDAGKDVAFEFLVFAENRDSASQWHAGKLGNVKGFLCSVKAKIKTKLIRT